MNLRYYSPSSEDPQRGILNFWKHAMSLFVHKCLRTICGIEEQALDLKIFRDPVSYARLKTDYCPLNRKPSEVRRWRKGGYNNETHPPCMTKFPYRARTSVKVTFVFGESLWDFATITPYSLNPILPKPYNP